MAAPGALGAMEVVEGEVVLLCRGRPGSGLEIGIGCGTMSEQSSGGRGRIVRRWCGSGDREGNSDTMPATGAAAAFAGEFIAGAKGFAAGTGDDDRHSHSRRTK